MGSEDQTEQARFRVRAKTVHGFWGAREAALSVPVQLRCRRSTQSALFSFLDVDGSVALAAVLKPRRPWKRCTKPRLPPSHCAQPRPSGEAMPILVSLSGVGVEPQAQARVEVCKRLLPKGVRSGSGDRPMPTR